MNDNFRKYITAKVNEIIASILWLIFVAATFFVFRKELSTAAYGSLFIELAICTIFIVKKKYHTQTTAILLLAILTLTVPYIGARVSGMLIVTVLCAVSLYINKGILYSFAGVYCITYTIIYYSNNHTFDIEFFTNIGFIGITAIVLYFVTMRSADLIYLSIKKESETKELLNSLDNMVSVIEKNTFSLGSDINNCNKDIGTLRSISDVIASNVRNITEGVSNQSESIANISDMMNNADGEMSEINKLSKNLAEISQSATQVVYQGYDRINEMGKQMNIINLTVSESITTVEELNKSMDEVNNFLTSIKQISDQTNLLALNASIEAARAGESGAGFTVVANEIKKLAEQSSNTVKQIDKIVNDVKAKMQLVFEKASNGGIAVKEGDSITKQVIESFGNIKLAFKDIDENIEKELKMTDTESIIFMKIREQSDNISSISQESSAAMEEILATIEEQNNNIEVIFESIKNINNSSIKLEELIEKR